MRDYADRFIDHHKDWLAMIKKEYGDSISKYREARRRSYNTNFSRLGLGFANTGSMILNNAIVDRSLEFGLLRNFNNQQKRLIWYGLNAF